jgi:hypothetical protein
MATAFATKLLVDDRSAVVQSQYIRYGVRVMSRYAAIYKLEPIEAARVSGGKRYLGWRGMYLPDTLPPADQLALPPPVILAALPLTRAAEDPDDDVDSACGVLVVIDEIAFQACGISEGLVAEIKQTANYAPDGVRELPEYGRSSINTHEAWTKLPLPAGAGYRLRLDGPYGFTLEPSSPEPKFTSSAYVLRPPFGPELDPQTRSKAWDMLRVRFQRVRRDDDPADPSPTPTAWTKPVWLQLGANGKALTPTHATLTDRTLSGLPSLPISDPPDARALYVAVTRSIVNVQGGAHDELYLSTSRIDRGVATLVLPAGLDTSVRLYARILEVQRAMPRAGDPATFPADDTLWQALFPKDDPATDLTEPRFRIVRVSSRITIR